MEITFLYNGDSSDINEWSNFPYFITETYKECGYKINRVNMHIKYWGILYDFFVTRFVRKMIGEKTTYNFLRSKFRGIIIDSRLKHVVKKYPNTDIFFCISDNFNPHKYTKKKCVMLCDWTYEFEILYDQNKSIDKWERFYCITQLEMMKKATINIVLRDECMKMIQAKYPEISIFDQHIDVVNCAYKNIDESIILERKLNSDKIVFIGAKRYIGGAKALLKVIRKFASQYKKQTFYFLGINKNDIEEELLEGIDDKCFFYGYLNKGDDDDFKKYYTLLMDAKMCINTNENFVSIAGIMEACYLYNPSIVSKNYQTISYLGEENFCGFYCENNVEQLNDCVQKIIHMPEKEYSELCIKCHKYFEEKTWKNLIDQWMKAIEE